MGTFDRRTFGTAAVMGATVMVLPGSAQADTVKDTDSSAEMLVDAYWRAQWLIGEYEQDLADMRNHSAAMAARPTLAHSL